MADIPPKNAPDPARNYERADPRNESPEGTLDHKATSPNVRPDRGEQAVPNRQKTDHDADRPLTPENEIAGDMHTEEPEGWDQAPQDIHDPKQQRHPRPDGVGGLKPNRKVDH
ncbi:MAG: hypothetical protein QM770_23885 [Tepidisphaeraceae bacterium]